MKYKPFWPGDKVQLLFDYDGISSGSVGNIITRWMGIVYLIQLEDGTFRWISDRSFAPMYPERHRLQEGEYGVITTNERVNLLQWAKCFAFIKLLILLTTMGLILTTKLNGLPVSSYVSIYDGHSPLGYPWGSI